MAMFSALILVFQVGKGLLRVLRCDPFSIADFVPVDFANNMLLAVGWVNAMHRYRQNNHSLS